MRWGVVALPVLVAACRFDVDRLSFDDGAAGGDATGGDGSSGDGGGGGDGGGDALSAACVPPPNDNPTNALDVSGGANVCFLLDGATQDFGGLCSPGTTGRDLFFQLDLPSQQLVYLDTFGSTVPTVVQLWDGPCDGTPSSISCIAAGCATDDVIGAFTRGPGPVCIVVREAASPMPGGAVWLRLVPTGGLGLPLVEGTNVIDTCEQTNDLSAGGCAGTAPEARYYRLLCPGMTSTSVLIGACDPDGRNVNLFTRPARINDSDLGCNTDVCSPIVSFGIGTVYNGPSLYWFVVDGPGAGDCGPTTLSVSVDP